MLIAFNTVINPSAAEAGIFQASQVNTIAADDSNSTSVYNSFKT